MLYEKGKPILRTALSVFFRRITVIGEPCEEGALLAVANHPNMALDPFLVVTRFQRGLFFLAKSTLFRGTALSALLRAAHMIPIYRRSDDPSQVGKNAETFRTAVEILMRREGVVIFPEGVSLGTRLLEEMRSGAARIAFQAEDEARFALGLRIQPIGINYGDLDLFEGTVTVVFGEPFSIEGYRELYEADAQAAVKQLTTDIGDRIQQVVAHVRSAEHEVLIEKIAELYQLAGSEANDFERFQRIADSVAKVLPLVAEERAEFERRLDSLLALRRSFGIDSLSLDLKPGWRTLWALPSVVFGALIHYLPYRAVGLIVDRTVEFAGARGSAKLGYGIAIFLSWYLLLALMALLFFSPLVALSFVLLCAVSGYVASRERSRVRLVLLSWLWPGRRTIVYLLSLMMNDLIADCERYRALAEEPVIQ